MTFIYGNEKLSGVKAIGQHLFLSQLENNLKSFLEWGLLNIGGFINVTRSQSNIHGSQLFKLKPTVDPNYKTSQIWQTMRKDWVWETGIQYCGISSCFFCVENLGIVDELMCIDLGTQCAAAGGTYTVNSGVFDGPPTCTCVIDRGPVPDGGCSSITPLIHVGNVFAAVAQYYTNNYIEPILISGIYINNEFYPVGTDDPEYSYKVDYNNSRIVFDNQVCSSLDIQMEYAYRWAQVYTYDNAKWWQQLQYRTDENTLHFNQIRQGDFSIFSTNRIQLPSIIIESIPRGLSKPYRLGDKSLIMEQDVMCHIISENRHDRNMLIDILRLQQDKVIWLYDTNEVIKNGAYPYNIDGTLNDNRLQYDQLLNTQNYRFNKCMLKDIYASDVESFSPFLSESSVRLTLEVIFEIMN